MRRQRWCGSLNDMTVSTSSHILTSPSLQLDFTCKLFKRSNKCAWYSEKLSGGDADVMRLWPRIGFEFWLKCQYLMGEKNQIIFSRITSPIYALKIIKVVFISRYNPAEQHNLSFIKFFSAKIQKGFSKMLTSRLTCKHHPCCFLCLRLLPWLTGCAEARRVRNVSLQLFVRSSHDCLCQKKKKRSVTKHLEETSKTQLLHK